MLPGVQRLNNYAIIIIIFSSDLTKLLVLEMMGYSVSDQHLRDAVKNSDFVLNEKRMLSVSLN